MSISLSTAANRFGFGMGPREARQRQAAGQWLSAQLQEKPYRTKIGNDGSANVVRAFRDLMDNRRREAARGGIKNLLIPVYTEQVHERFRRAIKTDEPVRERLTWFWSNHFCVSIDKLPVLGLAGYFEREAIAPQVSGSFEDMLIAVARHPAMLFYLDNILSFSPDSPLLKRFGKRAEKRKGKIGINENLAREILELHTLGVGAGYTQTDVTELARILTGWTLGGGPGPLAAGDPGRFTFREGLHDPGTKTLMGRRYGAGYAEGERALRDLARHPATAQHLATRLVSYYFGEPVPELVASARQAYLDSHGHLGHTFNALLQHNKTWTLPAGRFRPPEELITAALRLLEHVPDDPKRLFGVLESMGQRPWGANSPAGWNQGVQFWGSGDAMLRRIEWSSALAGLLGAGKRPAELARLALGERLDKNLATAISRADSAQQGIALLLSSPAFQWS